jgi:hypothetical protein
LVNTLELANGNFVTMAVAEVTAVPYFELYDKALDRANYMNQVLFTQIISSMHRKSIPNQAAFEFLFQSVPVSNQTYKAQVKLYFIVRRIGANRIENEKAVADTMSSIQIDLEEKNYVVEAFDKISDYESFAHSLEKANCSRVLSVSKKEKAVPNALSANGLMYYNEVVEPSENINTAAITNALTQYPNSVISLQIIPTKYSVREIYGIEENKNFLNHYVSQIRFGHGLRVDANTQMLVDAYDYYSEANNEPLFLYNFLIYSEANSTADLANRLIDSVEVEGKATGSALTAVDVSDFAMSPAQNIFASPWIFNNILLYKARDLRFWSGKAAPVHLQRLKHLMTMREFRGVFKFPIDDEKLIGLDSKKVLANRERLHQSIIAEGNFKVGIIQNVSMSGKNANAHAGIPLNDFTKHGLIVGMPGSGKTNFSLGLLLQFWKDFHIPFLAIEPTKSEYRSLIDAIPNLQIFTPGKAAVSPYIINPFVPPKGVTVESFVPSLMSAFKAAFSMPNPLPDLFLSAINDCYNEYGWRNDSTTDDPDVQFFGLYEFIKVFKRKMQRMDYKGEVKSNMESAGVVRLVSLIEQNSNIYDTVHTIPLEDLLSKPTVIELNAINNKEQKSLIMALLLIMMCVYTKNNVAGDGKLKNVMLIDEAHVLLAGSAAKSDESADSQGSTIESLEDMIAEIRSYGTSIIIADQSPTKVGRNIVANTNVKVIFKLVEKENKDAISTATNMNEADYDLLGRLGVGEALLHYGRVYSPLHIKTYNVHDRAEIRDVIPDTEIASMTTYWDSHQKLLIPHRECVHNGMCKDSCDFKLRSGADFVASRLVNTLLYDVADKTAFVKLLVQLDRPILGVLKGNPTITPSVRLSNCIKIKFLRKALLVKSFGITKAEYEMILKHPNFLKGGSRDA